MRTKQAGDVSLTEESFLDKSLTVAKTAALYAIALFFVGGFMLFVTSRDVEVQQAKHLDTFLDHTTTTLDMMEDDVYGTTRQANIFISHATQTVDSARPIIASLTPLVASFQQSADNVQVTTKLSQKIALDSRLTIDNMNSAALDERFYFEHQIPELFTGINTSVNTFNARLTEFGPIEKNVQDMTFNGVGITKDAKDEADRFVHPPPQPWWKKTWNATNDTGKLAWDFLR